MRYYRYRWNEMRDDEYNSWGFSTHWYEVEEDGYPSRQMEIYDDGTVLKYDSSYLSDEYGMLADVALGSDELEESKSEEISAEEFEANWEKFKALNQSNN